VDLLEQEGNLEGTVLRDGERHNGTDALCTICSTSDRRQLQAPAPSGAGMFEAWFGRT
jgi:hypothetical protein